MAGWTGKLLRVNLTEGVSTVEDIPQEWLREYIGGRGLAARYLYEEMDPKADPLSPENNLIFATGPLTGTPTPCGARYMVVTKGALTGAIACSNSGGFFGNEGTLPSGTLAKLYPNRSGEIPSGRNFHLLAFECKVHQVLDIPSNHPGMKVTAIVGLVVGVHIDDEVLVDGIIDTNKIQPLARLGYMEYAAAENIFSLNRPVWQE